MPLEKAKPGTPGFGRNIATEIKAGKKPAQAEAIAYSKAHDIAPGLKLHVHDSSYDIAKAAKVAIERKVDEASKALKAFPRMANGLTPDNVKASAEYRKAKTDYDRTFAEQRSFNTQFMRLFGKQYEVERKNSRTKDSVRLGNGVRLTIHRGLK